MKALYVLWGYCALLLAGGIAGYTVGGSKASLYTSLISCGILLILSYFVAKRKKAGLISCMSFLALLDTFFTFRWTSTQSIPSGVMAIVSFVSLIGFVILIRKELAAESKL